MGKIQYNPWSIQSGVPMNQDKRFYESVFSQGNGYMGLRGTLPEDKENESYERCAYIAGVFDYIKQGITDMVNTPDYMISSISLEEEIFQPLGKGVSDFNQELCMENGTLIRSYLWTTLSGKKLWIKSTRYLSIADIHTAALRYEITPLNFSGTIHFETGIDTNISNQPVADDQMKQNEDVLKMIAVVNTKTANDISLLEVKTTSSADITIAYAFTLQAATPVQNKIRPDYFSKETDAYAKQGEALVFDKLISIYTSRECEKEQLMQITEGHAKQNLSHGFDKLLKDNQIAWRDRWNNSDIEIIGDNKVQSALRYNIFQLIQTNAMQDSTVNIGARGIMHGRYKGCYFWDTDIFMLPFYISTNPEAARNLVKYRYLKLEDARANAAQMNLKGAKYPWMCSINGREQCESWDIGSSEVHITADVAFAVDMYCQESRDMDFLMQYGVEIYIETARYWESRLTYDSEEMVYNLLFVKGPDEYCGITANNTYTNWLIRYNMQLALSGIAYLEKENPTKLMELAQRLNLMEDEKDKWQDIIDKIKILYEATSKLYLQDETFMKLEPLDIAAYKTDEIPLYRKICFDRLQRYRVLKQADLLLLMTMLPEDFTVEQKQAAWDLYEPLTLHDSSLSYGVHTLLAANLGDLKNAEEYFIKSLFLDIENVMGNAGNEGLHFAAFGITWQAVIRGFAGIQTKDGTLIANPKLPSHWERLRFPFWYQNKRYQIEITHDEAKIVQD